MGLNSDQTRQKIALPVMGGGLIALLTATFVLVGVLLVRLETQQQDQLKRDRVFQIVHDIRESLGSRIYLNIYKISAVSSLVAMNPDLTQQDFARAIEVQFRGEHDLRNIALARDMIIQYMYPIEGNETAIGLDYTKVPDQIEAISRAINLNEIVLAGPVSLVQGGVGIIARTPILLVDSVSGQQKFWGLSSSVMNSESLLASAGVQTEQDNLRIAIRGRDALGADGEVFWGDPTVFDKHPVVKSIELPHGSWQVGAIPADGWDSELVLFTPLLWSYYLGALAILVFSIVIMRLTATRQNTLIALQAAEERLEKTAFELTENIPVGTYTMVQPPEGGLARLNFMSSRFLELTGLTRQDTENPLRVFDDIHPDDYDEWVAKNVQAFTDKTAFFGQTRVIVGGEVRWMEAESNPRTLPDGTTVWEGVLIDITDEKHLEEQLIREKEKAEAANIAKSQFLANMSHEIRTPLNGLIGFTDLLKKTPLTAVQQQYVNNANVSGHTLLGIISDILDFSKIEAGKLELESRRTDIIVLMEESIEVVRFTAEQKGLELLLNVTEGTPQFAHVDPLRLKQVLANLLSNAVKFTDAGEVELKLECEVQDNKQAKLSFSIRDTGIGISESQREKLFSAFSQADSSTTRKFGGTGLGLTISEMIAGKMGSNIQFSSTPGEGTTFYFDLHTTVEDGEQVDTAGIGSVRRCLIIDDNASQRAILEQILSRWGIECESCGSGSDALALLGGSLDVDVILCDYAMPGIDGLETIRLMGEQHGLTPDRQHIILLLSSMEHVSLDRQCEQLGIQFRLTKPVKIRELFDMLCRLHGTVDESASVPDTNSPETEPMPTSEATACAPRILIAEDVFMNMILLKALLKNLCPEVELFEAINGHKAVEQYLAVNPDLIFMDVQMPELDGLNATARIRTLEASTGRRVPIIALTAGVMKEEKDHCFEAGMDYFLTKPVEANKIKDILAECGVGW
jgi:PAS domain S-box-containing protein